MSSLYQIDKVTSRDFFTFSDIYLLGEKQQHPKMTTIQEIRRINARELARRAGSDAAFADRVGISASRASQLIGKKPIKNIGHTTARRIESAFDEPAGWLDALHDEKKTVANEKKTQQVVDVQTTAANDEITAGKMLELFDLFRSVDIDTRRQVEATLKAAVRLAARQKENRLPKK